MDFSMDHIVLNVVDMEKMLHFYTQILQLPVERLQEYRDAKVPFPSVRLTQDTIIDLFPRSLWEKMSPGEVCRPNLNHFCLAASRRSCEQLQQRLTEYGVTIEDGPSPRWGAHGTGISIYFRDPEENLIEIRYYEESAEEPCLLTS